MAVPFPSAQLATPKQPDYGEIGDMLFNMAQAKEQSRQFGQTHALDADKHRAALMQATTAQDRLTAEEEKAGALINNAHLAKMFDLIGNNQGDLAEAYSNRVMWHHGGNKYKIGAPPGLMPKVGTNPAAQPHAVQDLGSPPAEAAQAAMAPAVDQSKAIEASRPQPGMGSADVTMVPPQFAVAQEAERRRMNNIAPEPGWAEAAQKNAEAEISKRNAEYMARKAMESDLPNLGGVEGPLLPPDAAQQLAAQSVPQNISGVDAQGFPQPPTPGSQEAYDADLEAARKTDRLGASNAAVKQFIFPGFPGGSSLSLSTPQLRAPYEEAADAFEAQMTRMSPHHQEWRDGKQVDVGDPRYGQAASIAAQQLRKDTRPMDVAQKAAGETYVAMLKALIAGDKAPGNEPESVNDRARIASAGARAAAGGKADDTDWKRTKDVDARIAKWRQEGGIDKMISASRAALASLDDVSSDNPEAQQFATFHKLHDTLGRVNETEIDRTLRAKALGLQAQGDALVARLTGEGLGQIQKQQLVEAFKSDVQHLMAQVGGNISKSYDHAFQDTRYDPYREHIGQQKESWQDLFGLETSSAAAPEKPKSHPMGNSVPGTPGADEKAKSLAAFKASMGLH